MAKKVQVEKSHAKFSPSAAKRWLNCAGSINLSAKAPPQRDSDASKEGTLAHSVAEALLLNRETPRASEAIYGHMITFTDTVRAIKKRENFDDLLVETKVKLPFIHEELSGTIDVGLAKRYDTLHAIDLKYGRSYVSAKDNPQLLIYLIGLAHLYDFDFVEYKASIYQPKIKEDLVSHSYTNKDLRKFIDVLKRGIEATEKPNATFKAGEWCFFCPAKSICKEISKGALEAARLDFDAEIQPKPEDLDPEQFSKILEKAAYLKLWLAEVEELAIEKLKAREHIAGFELVPTRPSTKWADEEKLAQYVRTTKLGKYLHETVLLTPAQARKVLSKLISDKALNTFINKHTVTVSSGYKLQSTNNNSLDFSLELESEAHTKE